MDGNMKQKLNQILGKMDQKVLNTKLNKIIDMLKHDKSDELAKKINKLDKDELSKKMNEFESMDLNDLKIDKNDIQKLLSNQNLEQLSNKLDTNGKEIVEKIKTLLNNK